MSKRITFFDTETTGLEIGDHRIIEFFGATYDLARRKPLQALDQRIDPERSIHPDAQRTHGIALADLVGKPRWSDVAPFIHGFLTETDLLVAHNGKGFDLPFLNYEFERVGLTPIRTRLIDTMLEARWATAIGKVPSLGELCFACGVPYEPARAHSARYDVAVMAASFFRALDWGFFSLEETTHAAA